MKRIALFVLFALGLTTLPQANAAEARVGVVILHGN